MDKRFFLLSFLFCMRIISASCDSGQVDINGASVSELDKIVWVGPSTAQKIIDLRPFANVGELTKVNGIGDTKIKEIIEEGLACVESVSATYDEESLDTDRSEEEEKYNLEEFIEDSSYNNFVSAKSNNPTILQEINLSPQDIKSEINSEEDTGNRKSIYGLGIFSVVLGLLFLLRARRSKYQNEFR